MKKKTLSQKTCFILFVAVLLTVPTAMVSVDAFLYSVLMPEEWSTLPITDASGDVWRYPGESTCRGEQGVYHPEIDIINVAIIGSDLVFEFNSTPTVNNASYAIRILIDNDTDGNYDYHFDTTFGTGELQLIRKSDNYRWDGAAFISSSVPVMSITVSGNNVTIHDVIQPLPSLPSARLIIVWAYTGEAGYTYMDYALDDPDCTDIPSFSWLLALFSVLTIMGLIIYMRKEKISL